MSGNGQLPGITQIDHLGIAVPTGQMDQHVQLYEQMGFKVIHREEVRGTDMVREVLLQIGDSDNKVQLLEPMDDSSPVHKQIEKSGGRPTVAHIAYQVKDVQKAFDDLTSKGFKIIDDAPRAGSAGTMVFFVHPKTTEQAALGVLYEIVEPGADSH
ncbi:MAG: VOC family protein [Fimbriimonadaceae bacterium]